MGYAHGRDINLIPYLLHPNVKVPDFIRNLRYIKSKQEETSFIESLKALNSTINTLNDKSISINSSEIATDDYSGHFEVEVNENVVTDYYSNGFVDVNKVIADQIDIPVNSFLTITDILNKSHSAILQLKPDSQVLQPVFKVGKNGIWGVYARNREQSFALSLANDDAIKLVTIIGNKHTDKMKLAIASAFQKVIVEGKYQRILLSRPLSIKQAKEVRPLPESVTPWMQPFFDILDMLISDRNKENGDNISYKQLVYDGILEITDISSINNRIIRNAYIIIDDAQILSIDEIRDIICSIGEDSKLVLTSDLPHKNNSDIDGMQLLISKLKGQKHYGHLTMKRKGTENLSDMFGNLLF
jgi:PhoH-like ATPase